MTRLFKDFFNNQKSGGLVLMACTVLSLIFANTPFQSIYNQLWNFEVAGHTSAHWVNDGLMTIFFLLVGLELEREVYIGELSTIKKAMLPVIAALGGMLIPAGIYFFINANTPTQSGVGIPMATDIAFALAVLSLLGNRVPLSLKVFLTALAVIDDLGAILVIAVFYTDTLQWMNLFIALGTFGLLIMLNRMKIHNLIPYLIGGVVMWYFMLHSGVHATISGVLLAFAIPFGTGDRKSISYVLQEFLHFPVSFIILPLFALANTNIVIPAQWIAGLMELNSIGIAAGLFIGKPVGITLFSYLSALASLTRLPGDLNWKHIFGAGILGGIGFTMSIFITLLAFKDQRFIDGSKIAIIITSTLAGVAGFIFLKMQKQTTTL